MKKILSLIVLATGLLMSCTGDPGPPGFDGQDGINILGQTFEVENIDFGYNSDSNLWSYRQDFPTDIEVFESDAVFVYRFDGQTDLSDGTTADIWSLIPQNFFTNEGTLQYVTAHTFLDVDIFIDGNYDLSSIDFGFTDDQIFRFVVIPSDFALTVDVTNLDAVMNAINSVNQDRSSQLDD